jgi:hypothetical protein
MQIETEAPDERTVMIRAAVKSCFAARPAEAINVSNVSAKLPDDFWIDEAGMELEDGLKFREIQAAYTPAPKSAAPMIENRPDGQGKLAVLARHAVEPDFPEYLPPSDNVAKPTVEPQGRVPGGTDPKPVKTIAEPVAIESTPGHAVERLGLSPQERLSAARLIESDLIGRVALLKNAVRAASEELHARKIEYAENNPNRETPAQLSASYRASSQAERKARVAREGGGQPRIAYVDYERSGSFSGDGNTFARRHNRNGGNKRGAYGKQSLGMTNRDETRGPVPAPEPVARPTIPALAK